MSLLSLEFVALSIALILWLRVVPDPLRLIGFLAGSALFAASFLEPIGIASTTALCFAGFGLSRLCAARPRWTAPSVTAVVVAFIYFQQYDLVVWALPNRWLTTALETAGLSYLLFKILHVIVDSGGGRMPSLSLPSYLAYCINFTTFLLGPIQRYPDFQTQWQGGNEPLDPSLTSHLDALNRVLRGFVKKFVVSEWVAVYALLPGESAAGLSGSEILIGAWAFYLFLYLDFSGYCDIMIGIGSLMGIRPPENFWLPFFSPNIAQYWLRVHRSLTTWLTDYVFQPIYTALLRSPRFRPRRLLSRNLSIAATMLVAGLWHGTTTSFLLFGLVHAFYQVCFRTSEALLERRLGRAGLRTLRANRVWIAGSTLLTFVATASAYLFFVLDPASLAALFGLEGVLGGGS